MNYLYHLMFLVFSIPAIALGSTTSNVQTVGKVDLNRYLGQWYEVASIPQSFQKKCISNSQANYSLTKAGMIKVLNSCKTKNGEVKTANARAKVVSKDGSNSKLKVTFVKIFDWIFSFGGDYWILDLAEDYSYAVVGDPTTKYAWILSRTPEIQAHDLEAAKRNLSKNGYDTCQVLMTIQDGGFSERKPLCEMVRN